MPPQDPTPKIRFGPIRQRQGQGGSTRTPGETQFQNNYYDELLPNAYSDPHRTESKLLQQVQGLDPESLKRVAALRQALESRIASGKQVYRTQAEQEQTKSALERLKGAQGFDLTRARIQAGAGPGLAMGADLFADIGATILGVGTPPQELPTPPKPGEVGYVSDKNYETLFAPTMGPRKKGRGLELNQSGLFEAVTGGASDIDTGRANIQKAVLAGATGFDDADRKTIQSAIANEMLRRENGLPSILPNEDLEQIKAQLENVEDPGAAGMIAQIVELLSATRLLGPGQIGARVGQSVSRAIPQATRLGQTTARIAGGVTGEAASFGIAEGLLSQDPNRAIEGAKFGAGAGAAGATVARSLLLGSGALRNQAARYLGRGAAEMAKLRAGRLSASVGHGWEAMGEALTGGIGEDAIASLIFGAPGRNPTQVRGGRIAEKRELVEGKERGRAEVERATAETARREAAAAAEATAKAEVRSKVDSLASLGERSAPKGSKEPRISQKDIDFAHQMRDRLDEGLSLTDKQQAKLDKLQPAIEREVQRREEVAEQQSKPPEVVAPKVEAAPVAAPVEVSPAPAKGKAVKAPKAPKAAQAPTRDKRFVETLQGRTEEKPAVSALLDGKAAKKAIKDAEARGMSADEWKAQADKARKSAEVEQKKAQKRVDADPEFSTLTKSGKETVARFLGYVESIGDAVPRKDLREFFVKKLAQVGKWKDAKSKKASVDARTAEAERLLDASERHGGEASRQRRVDELAKLQEQAKSQKASAEKGTGDRPVTSARRTKGRETPQNRADAAPRGFERKVGDETVVEAFDPVGITEAHARLAEKVEAQFGQFPRDTPDALARSFVDAMISGNEARVFEVAREIQRFAIENPNPARSGEAGFALADLFALPFKTDPAKALAAFRKKIPTLGGAWKETFGRLVGPWSTRNLARQATNYVTANEGERLVNLTPEGPAKSMAQELDTIYRERALPGMKEFESRVFDKYAKLVEETSKPAWSKGTEQVTIDGVDWHRYEAEILGKIPVSPELRDGIETYRREYTPSTWNAADDAGLTSEKHRGKKIGPDSKPYLLQILSPHMRAEASMSSESSWFKGLRETTKKMAENREVDPKRIDEHLDNIRKSHNKDIEIRIASERKHAIEMVRDVVLPGRHDGRDVTEPRLSQVIGQHYRGLSYRAGFEAGFRGKELSELRKEFADAGGDPARLDRWLEAAQGTSPRFSDWAARFYAEHPMMRETLRGFRTLYDFKNTVDLSLSGVSAAPDFIAGPSVHLFGKYHFKSLGKETAGFAKRALGMDRRTAWEIAKSAQELSMRVQDRTMNRNAPIGERIEDSARMVRQHVADILFRPINRGTELVTSGAFEMLADDIAKAVSAGKRIPFSRHRQKRLQQFMGWSDAHAQKFNEGKFTKSDVRAAVDELSANLYAATSNPMFRAAALKNPVVRYAFRFASHATKQLRITTNTLRDLSKAVYTGKQIPFHAREAATILGQQAAKGAGLMILKALLNGDNVNPWDKNSNLWAKVRNDPLSGIPSFLFDSLWYGGVMGPYAMALGEVTGMNASAIQEVAEKHSPAAAKIAGLAALTGPVQLLDEGLSAAYGLSSYRDQDTMARLRTIVEKRIPFTRAATNLAVMSGFKDGNKDLDNGISAVYRWKRANDRMRFVDFGDQEDGHNEMRRELREGLREMAAGKTPAPWIVKAITAKGKDAGDVADSLRARKVLEKNINPEDWEELRAEMGEAQFNAVVNHDQLLEEWARMIVEAKGEGVAETKRAIERQQARVQTKLGREGLDEKVRAKAGERASRLSDAATQLMELRDTPAAAEATRIMEERKPKRRSGSSRRKMDKTGEEILRRLDIIKKESR